MSSNKVSTMNKPISQASRLSSYSSATLLIASCALLVLLASIIQVECLFKRMQYHEQGTHGPKSYKFGFTSGDHKNPMERHEVSDGEGHVKGWYSFVDPYGKHQVIHYSSHPKLGFQVLNHNSKAQNNGQRHYGS